jgi:hypothetical protein
MENILRSTKRETRPRCDKNLKRHGHGHSDHGHRTPHRPRILVCTHCYDRRRYLSVRGIVTTPPSVAGATL